MLGSQASILGVYSRHERQTAPRSERSRASHHASAYGGVRAAKEASGQSGREGQGGEAYARTAVRDCQESRRRTLGQETASRVISNIDLRCLLDNSVPNHYYWGMARKIALATYWVWMPGSGNQRAILSDIGDGHLDFLDVFEAFLEARKHVPDEIPNADKTADTNVDPALEPIRDGRTVTGYVRQGEYNISSTLKNLVTGDETKRTPQHAEMMDHFFRLTVPAGERRGLLIVQRWSNQSPLSIFSDSLAKYCQEHISNTAFLHVDAAHPAETYKNLLQGATVDSVTVVARVDGPDEADALNPRIIDQAYDVQVKLIPRGGAFKQLLHQFIDSPQDVTNSVEIAALGLGQIKSVKASAAIGGDAPKQYNLLDLDKGHPYHTVTDQVELDPGTRVPLRDSLNTVASELEETLFNDAPNIN